LLLVVMPDLIRHGRGGEAKRAMKPPAAAAGEHLRGKPRFPSETAFPVGRHAGLDPASSDFERGGIPDLCSRRERPE
jgi:hypothetical protein